MKNKCISLFLAVVLLFSAIAVSAISASAADENVVYFDNSITNFDTVECGLFNDADSAEDVSFEAMTLVKGDVWSYEFSGDFDKVIFKGEDAQSQELEFEGSGKIAKANTWQDGFDVTWSDYSENVTETVTDGKTKMRTGAANTIYCKNEAGWSSVYCYMWNGNGGSGNENKSWPGVQMKDSGDGVWEYTPDKTYSNVIFNGDGAQTANLTAPSGVKIFNNKTNEWEDYSTGPVKITSFTTGIASPSYTNVSVKISASATSTAGAVSYKFGVKDASGASATLSDGASSTTAWVPTKAGKYTLTLDVTDTAGNKESRTLAFEIQDASSLESAFISAFTNSLGTNKTLLQNSNVTFTTGAIGGKVGTNLLFYKFVITDPDGNTNTAYYTTGNTYTYKPTKIGKYTVEAYVQNSYNDTVSNTYSYECKTSIPADDKDDNQGGGGQPATQSPQPATQPASNAPETVGPTVSDAKLGDVNRDGNISIKDATLIQKAIAFLTSLDSEQKELADVNGDKNVNIKDATLIQKYLANMITSV